MNPGLKFFIWFPVILVITLFFESFVGNPFIKSIIIAFIISLFIIQNERK